MMTTLKLLARVGQNEFWRQRQRMQLMILGNVGTRSRFILNWSNTTQCMSLAPFFSSRHAFSTKKSPDLAGKTDTKASPALADEIFGNDSNLGLFAKFKLMYKKYWYVLIPVHVVTSIGWFGSFYYLSKSGVDIPALLQSMHLDQSIVDRFQSSSMGHYAIAYLCFKVATPLRYAVTLGGTTVSIKYLVQAGHIKPIPSKQEFMRMYEQKKAEREAPKLEEFEEKHKPGEKK